MTNHVEVSRVQAWIMAIRPQSLPAGASPVIIGVGLAVHDGVFAAGPAFTALIGALFLQIGSNLTNDYYDAIRGADTDNREGFTRVTQSGLLSAQTVRLAMYTVFTLAILTGVYLVAIGGVPILVVGLLSVIAGYTYTGGPYPFGYYGLGDLFVFIFFGIIAVTGTYYVQAVSMATTVGTFPIMIPPGTVPITGILASLPAAALSTGLLVVNNIRDLENDREAGKETLAVKIGYKWSRIEYVALLVLAYLIPVVFAIRWSSPLPAAPLLMAPFAWSLWGTVNNNKSGNKLNPALKRTGEHFLVFSVLFSLGLAGAALI